MSEDKEIVPRADMLMGSMRSMGYSFESAIADVIDNSISAHCSNVKILFPTSPLDKLAVGILDDGKGMDRVTLREAMRYGSTASEEIRDEFDLGRFGLGLKSASLSQCRILTVVSFYDGIFSAFSWDYNYVLKKKKWLVKELSINDIKQLPYFDEFESQKAGTLVVWQDFDILSKSNDGLIYDALNDHKSLLEDALSLIFHRFLSSSKDKLNISINNHRIKPQDPFLESHPKTTTKQVRTIAIRDSEGIERLIAIKPFVLPFASDLTEKDRKLIGGIENLRIRQGFYVYRNNRLIIWGTWFGMKPRAELTKNARIRVDIPNSLDDIWSIDIKKQSASIPKRIQQQLKNTVIQALDISTTKQTHRGRKEKTEEDKDFIWDRFQDRNDCFYYQINRTSKLFQFVREQLSEEDYNLFQLFIGEIEKNLPIQQIYIDKSNEKISTEVEDSRIDDVYQMSIQLITQIQKITNQTYQEIIPDVMKSEPFCNYEIIKDRLISYFDNETN